MQRALVVQPNSGYGDDNRCLIDVLTRGEDKVAGAWRWSPTTRLAVSSNGCAPCGWCGVTFNAALLGVEYYSKTAELLAELANLGMFVDLQVQADQMADMLPVLGSYRCAGRRRSLRAPTARSRTRSAGLRGALAAGRHGKGLRQDIGVRQVLCPALSVPGYLALCAAPARVFRCRPLCVGLRLAVPACSGADRLWSVAQTDRAPRSGTGRTIEAAVAHSAPPIRIRRSAATAGD